MKPKMTKAESWIKSCDFCICQDTLSKHYCLLYSVAIKNMDIVKCQDWKGCNSPFIKSKGEER